jgi:signal transduction histidine kinase
LRPEPDTPSPAGPRPRYLDGALASPRVGTAALAFVVVALAVLVLVPVFVERQTGRVREELDGAADPARSLVTRIQFALAREQSALRGYLISGDEGFLERYREAAAAEQETYRELEALAHRLGPSVIQRYGELRALADQWRERVEEVELTPRGAPDDDVVPRTSRSGSLFEDVLQAAADLDAAITEVIRERRSDLRAMERMSVVLTTLLVGVALVSASVLAWFSRRVRGLADAAEARRREAEEALAEVRLGVEARERLLRGITHDVKNPLGAADGYAELLEMGLRGPLTPEQEPLVAGVRRSVHAALAIIGDLLDLSRAESGNLPVQRAPTALPEMVRQAAEDHRGAAQVAGHTLEVQVADEATVLYTDPARVHQVLGNLLTNAIKYTPPGGHITIAAKPAEEGEHPAPGRWVAIEVADDGPGIPPGEQQAVFLEFQRGSTASSAGHGLGLAISRRIARLLGGDLTLRSLPGQGARFTLWLPLRAGEEADPEETRPPA